MATWTLRDEHTHTRWLAVKISHESVPVGPVSVISFLNLKLISFNVLDGRSIHGERRFLPDRTELHIS